MAHPTVVPRQLRDTDMEQSDEDTDVTPNYGVVRGHGARTPESSDESDNEVLDA